jgi:hypothetical protein
MAFGRNVREAVGLDRQRVRVNVEPHGLASELANVQHRGDFALARREDESRRLPDVIRPVPHEQGAVERKLRVHRPFEAVGAVVLPEIGIEEDLEKVWSEQEGTIGELDPPRDATVVGTSTP